MATLSEKLTTYLEANFTPESSLALSLKDFYIGVSKSLNIDPSLSLCASVLRKFAARGNFTRRRGRGASSVITLADMRERFDALVASEAALLQKNDILMSKITLNEGRINTLRRKIMALRNEISVLDGDGGDGDSGDGDSGEGGID